MNVRDKIPVCPHGTREDLDFSLVALCDFLNRMVGTEIIYTSGYRCEQCNKIAGGAENSPHLRGKAVDIVPINSNQRYIIIEFSILKRVRRIGIYEDHLHIDLDETLPQVVMWVE